MVEDAPIGISFIDRSLGLVHANSILAAIHGRTALDGGAGP